MKKLSRTYRITDSTNDMILELQRLYSINLGVSVSQADIIRIAVQAEYNSIDRSKLSLKQ